MKEIHLINLKYLLGEQGPAGTLSLGMEELVGTIFVLFLYLEERQQTHPDPVLSSSPAKASRYALVL